MFNESRRKRCVRCFRSAWSSFLSNSPNVTDGSSRWDLEIVGLRRLCSSTSSSFVVQNDENVPRLRLVSRLGTDHNNLHRISRSDIFLVHHVSGGKR